MTEKMVRDLVTGDQFTLGNTTYKVTNARNSITDSVDWIVYVEGHILQLPADLKVEVKYDFKELASKRGALFIDTNGATLISTGRRYVDEDSKPEDNDWCLVKPGKYGSTYSPWSWYEEHDGPLVPALWQDEPVTMDALTNIKMMGIQE